MFKPINMSENNVKIYTLKLHDLKTILQKLGNDVSGNKKVLIERLKAIVKSDVIDMNSIGSNISVSDEDTLNESTSTIINSSTSKKSSKRNKVVFRLINRINTLENKIKFLETCITKWRIVSRKTNQNESSIGKQQVAVKLNTCSSTACTPPGIDPKKIPEPRSAPSNGRNAEEKTKSCPSEEKIARSQSVPSTVSMQCKLKIPDKTNSKQVDNKNKILILSDSQGRNSAALLNKLLDYNYSVQSVCKPNAMFDDVVSDVDNLSKYFTRNDFVIILAGSNNVLKHKPISQETFEKLYCVSKRVNLIYTAIPYWKNNCDLNNSLFNFNKTIFNNLKLFNVEGRYFVETNEIIDIYSDKYNRDFHLNVSGKRKLFYYIAKLILNVNNANYSSSINFNNLIHVTTVSYTTETASKKVNKGVWPAVNFLNNHTIIEHL